MQYVRTISDSVSTAWNSINPATLSGAIDVIVVEQEDGSLSCSPFHVRFGKFSLLRPSDKKVEFKVNGAKQDYSMKLGEGGEAFFVFETTDNVPQSMQTSPLVSPVASPASSPTLGPTASDLKEPDNFELNAESERQQRPPNATIQPHAADDGDIARRSPSSSYLQGRPASGDWSDWSTPALRTHSDDVLRHSARSTDRKDSGRNDPDNSDDSAEDNNGPASERSISPPPLSPKEAIDRAMALSRELATANIPSKVTETGDLMLEMSGFKGSEEDMIRAEVVARNILTKVLDGNYDIGSLFGFDTEGNLWIYSSEEARKAAMKRTMESTLQHHNHGLAADAVSDPGYQSDGSDITNPRMVPSHRRTESDAGPMDMQTPPLTPTTSMSPREAYRNYAKTLRLTSEQLKDLRLKPGPNVMSFTVNRATCSANMYLWRHEVPVVISDIDGTITKSDALGHVLNMIGRDWTHAGIAKLYSDITANGYNIMYLTSRSVGQADTTRAYLANIAQENFRMPAGPTILSPDRTMAALRREVYLRQPQVFKMATLRDIRNLYGPDRNPFYAGFGNRLTDQISYRTVDVPPRRIFTINSNSEVSLDLLTLNKKMSYVNINEVVDHYFPPVSTLVTGGGEQCTDFIYWRDEPLPLDDFSASDTDGSDDDAVDDQGSQYDEDDEEIGDGLADSYISRESLDERRAGGKGSDALRRTSTETYEDADDEEEEEEEGEDEDEDEENYSEDDEEPGEARRHSIRTPSQRNAGEDVHAEIITGVADVRNGPGNKGLVLEEPVAIRAPPISP